MKRIKKCMAVFLALMMITAAIPMEALAVVLEDIDWYDGYEYVDIVNLPDDQSASGTNEFCTWSYDAETSTVYMDGVNIESTRDAYGAVREIGENGRINYNFDRAPLPLYTIIDDGGVKREQYCTFNFEHLILGKSIKNFNSHISGVVYKKLKSVTFEEGSALETVGTRAFAEFPLDELVLPDTVRTIGDYAFRVSEIKRFKIPAAVTEISMGMFVRSKLEEIEIPKGVTTIGASAFEDTNISELIIPESVTEIGSYAASGTLVSKIDLPDSFSYVPEGMFENCKNVTSIDFLGDSITEIKGAAFSGCDGITSLDFTKTNIVAVNGFGGCTNLETVKLNENTTYISGFGECPKLKHIEFTDKIKKIGPSAFWMDENTTFSPLPASVENVGSNAFAYSGITEAVFGNPNVFIETGAFECCKKLTRVTLPESITRISDFCFRESALEEITIPKSVTNIGRYAFYGSAIKRINFAQGISLNYINEYAFANCLNLNSLIIPEGTKTIYKYAFCDDINLTRVIFNEKSTRFTEYNPFCLSDDNSKTYLTEIIGEEKSSAQGYAEVYGIKFIAFGDYVDPGNEEDYAECNKGTWENGTWLYDQDSKRLIINGTGKLTATFKDFNGNAFNIAGFISSKGLNALIITEGITSVDDNVFYSESGAETVSVSLPSTLTSIGTGSFKNIKAQSVNIKGNITSMGANAFYGSEINTIDLSGCSIKSISAYAFANCRNLTSVKLPDTVTEICDGAFYNTGLTSVGLGENVATLGKRAFGNCTALINIKIENDNISIYESTSNRADNSFGYDADGNLIIFNYRKATVVENALTVDASVNSNAFKYAEENALVALGDSKNADLSGYMKDSNSIKWHYYADTKVLYVQGVYNLSSYAFKSVNYDTDKTRYLSGGDGVFRLNDGTPVENLDVDLLYICSGVKIAVADFSQINPRYVHFAETVTAVGGFENCTNLKMINLPDNVTSIYDNTFKNCRGLVKATLGKGCKGIPHGCFENCTSLKEVNYDNALTIGARAFYQCSGLEEIIIPKSVIDIKSEAFASCVGVKKITLNGGTGNIERLAFSAMPFCTQIIINTEWDENTKRANDSFYNIGLSSTGVELATGDDVVNPDFSGFKDVYKQSKTKITSIHFGKNVDLSYIAFAPELTYLKVFTVSSENRHMYVYENNLYYDDVLVLANPNVHRIVIKDGTKTIGSGAFENSVAMFIGLPESVTEIQEYAFAQMENLRRIDLSNNLRSVLDYAFYKCENLMSIEFPSMVNTIGSHCFDGCTSLEYVVLPNRITAIEPYTFYYCTALQNIVIPKLVNTVGESAFGGCKSMQNIFLWRTAANLKTMWLSGWRSYLTIHTPVGSAAYTFAKNNNINCTTYASSVAFGEVCDAQLEADGQFVDICRDGHGETDYLIVYEPDCENDGYIIGVCEYCSEILEEIHETATGHSYAVTADIEPTETTRGVKQFTCTKCGESYCEYTEPLGPGADTAVYTVTGRVIYDTKGMTKQEAPVRKADVVIDGNTVATTNDEGVFTLELETGSYVAEIRYTYGYTRTVGIVVEDEDIDYQTPITIVGCDFNKDGRVDDDDLEMFSFIISSQKDDPSYLDYADFNHDGYINAIDFRIIKGFSGTSAGTYEYPIITIQK